MQYLDQPHFRKLLIKTFLFPALLVLFAPVQVRGRYMAPRMPFVLGFFPFLNSRTVCYNWQGE